MTPLKLIMHAFGPFAAEQEIDFERLGKRRIFLITGETGAGKTTIFDAISVALYGSASGENRKAYTLKSHHAPAAELCWVRLTFQLREARYEIYRQPQQTGLKRDGSPKDLGEKAELTLPDGELVVGATAVTKRLTEILGLSYTQFKQTIMMAQGEFRQLLEATSVQKQEIFSKIFGTGDYRALTEALAARQTELSRQAQAGQQAIARCVGELGRLGYGALAEESAQYLTYDAVEEVVRGGLSLHEANLERLRDDIDRLEKRKGAIHLEQAAELNRKLDRYNALLTERQSLEARETEMEAAAARLARLRSAAELREQEKIILSLKQSIADAAERSARLSPMVREGEEALRQAEAAYARLPQLRKRMEEVARELDSLDRQEGEAARRRSLVESIRERSLGMAERRKRLEALEQTAGYRALLEEMAALEKAASLLEGMESDFLELEAAEAERERCHNVYQARYRTFLDSQAAILAEALEEGKPCPVCGSVQHPAPVAGRGNTVGERAVGEAKDALDNATSRIVLYKMDIEKKRDLLGMLSLPLGLTSKQPPRSDIKLLLNRILSTLQDKKIDRDQRLERFPALQSGEAPQQVAEETANEIRAIAVDQGAIAQLEFTLNETRNTMDMDQIRETRAALSKEQAQLRGLAESGERSYVQARAKLEGLAAEYAAVERQRKESEEQFQRLRAEFIRRLKESGFSGYADYESSAKDLHSLEQLAAGVQRYEKSKASVAAQLSALAPDVEGRELADLDRLRQEYDEIERSLRAARESYTEIHGAVMASRNRLEELQGLWWENAERSRLYTIACDLASLAKGSKGPGISFERYILASYFEDVIQIANIHLQRMTGARYRLKRRQDKTRGASSGLDMDVIDSYTGTRRSVSTLSGGEGFKASLALALGLSDVVQIYAGGVSIDTIFIDEGFGSLDERSLDSAIDTLLSLEDSGRMVGVISHVSRLRDAIGVKLLVHYSPTGSRASFAGVE